VNKIRSEEILYVDVTQTWESDAQTGIQRVVRQLVASWLALNLNVALIVFQKGEYKILPKTAELKFGLPYSSRVTRDKRYVRKLYSILMVPYLLMKKNVNHRIFSYIKQSWILKTVKSFLVHTWIPDDSTKLNPKNSNILLLDLVYSATQIEYLKTISSTIGTRVTVFCHDLNPINYPELFPDEVCKLFGDYVSLMDYSAKIWSISKTTQEDVLKIKTTRQSGFVFDYKWLPPSDLPLCNHGDGIRNSTDGVDYILVVASFLPHKNHFGLFDSLQILAKKGAKIPHVCLVGGANWMDGSLESRILELRKAGVNVEKYQNLDDCCVRKLYENCLFTVLPSFVEGFGLPIVESLSFGKPVVTSDATSMGELLSLPGTLGFSHNSEPSLSSVLENVLSDSELLEKKTADAQGNRKNLGSWSEYAQDLYVFATGK